MCYASYKEEINYFESQESPKAGCKRQYLSLMVSEAAIPRLPCPWDSVTDDWPLTAVCLVPGKECQRTADCCLSPSEDRVSHKTGVRLRYSI